MPVTNRGFKKMKAEPHVDLIVAEAGKFRLALEAGKERSVLFVSEDFPVMSCKLASILFAYHIIKKWPGIVVHGVSGSALNHDGDDTISHYWLECQGVAIDLTADQYNILEDNQLNSEIIKSRPFSPVSIGGIGRMRNYKLFRVFGRDTYVSGLADLAEDFLRDLHDSYDALSNLE